MHSKHQFCNSLFCITSRAATATLVIAIVTLFALGIAAQAQTYNVIYNFTGGRDGSAPLSGLTADRAGNLYGTAVNGGGAGYGTVFKLQPYGSSWIFAPLYNFSGPDGAYPNPGLIVGPDGALYGTTNKGGGVQGCSLALGCGVVFSLQPPPSSPPDPLAPWNETVLYTFYKFYYGVNPYSGVTFDGSGNIFGTTSVGGNYCCGTVYELQRSGSSWTQSVIYNFIGGEFDGSEPVGPVTFDLSGNLYGVTVDGGEGYWGTIFKMMPTSYGWNEAVWVNFGYTDGARPIGGLIFDKSGNMFGTTTVGGSGSGGTVFEFSPIRGFSTIYNFSGGNGPRDKLTLDSAGNLYGTTSQDGAYGYGNVFKLTNVGGVWTYTSLYDFTNGNDGRTPYGGVLIDANSNLFGTASGGAQNNGVIWEITP